jgi:glycine cleavage system H protein
MRSRFRGNPAEGVDLEGGAMAIDPGRTIYYKRARFTTRLPIDRLYSRSHYWLAEEGPGQFRIGLTRFATRMLGDFVELNLAVKAGEQLAVGQAIGSIEGFKAVSEIYCVVAGELTLANSKLDQDPALLDNDPYDSGWLYRVTNARVEEPLDVHGYIGLLDATIERMLLEQQQGKDKPC